jgi:hypothetical protein
VRTAIYCALSHPVSNNFHTWAVDWLSGKDRTRADAYADTAADDAYAVDAAAAAYAAASAADAYFDAAYAAHAYAAYAAAAAAPINLIEIIKRSIKEEVAL